MKWEDAIKIGCANASEQGQAWQEIERLKAIVDAAWEVRREEHDYNPCPDLLLRANARKRLYELLDRWKAAEAGGKEFPPC